VGGSPIGLKIIEVLIMGVYYVKLLLCKNLSKGGDKA